MVMRNVHSCVFNINHVYDLKGSKVSRTASESERAKDLPVLKDNDFIEAKERIALGPALKTAFLEKLNADVEVGSKMARIAAPLFSHPLPGPYFNLLQFLAKHKLMDYSLLIGIHEREASVGRSGLGDWG